MNDSAGRPSSGPEDPGTPATGSPDVSSRPAQPTTPQPQPAHAEQPPQDATPPSAAVPPPPPAPGPAYPPGGYPPVPPYGYSYGYPGGPAPWATAARAPKPGVIPLRPLDIGDLFSGTFATFRRHWQATLVIAFVIGLITSAAGVVFNGISMHDPGYRQAVTATSPSTSLHYSLSHSGFTGLSLLITLAAQVISTALLIIVTSHAVLGRPTTLGTVCREGLPHLLRMLGLAVVTVLVVAVPVLLCMTPGLILLAGGSELGGSGLAVLGMLAGSLAACWLYVSYSLAAPALVLERQGVIAALGRSYKLVKGAWWRVFGIELLMLLVTFIAGAVIDLLIGLLSGSGSALGLVTTDNVAKLSSWSSILMFGLAGLITSLFALPVTAFARSLLYMDLRIRREELDVELAVAAGIPNPRTGV